MNNLFKVATAAALVAFSAGSFAAKPTSIVFYQRMPKQRDGTRLRDVHGQVLQWQES